MRIVAALGGNALLRRGEPLTPLNQALNVQVAAAAVAALIRSGQEVVVSHGNGPQVGLLALQTASTPDALFPLDVLGAESQGMIGYLLEQALDNALDSGHLLATLLTRVRVDRRDPAFRHPVKPIGPLYDEERAKELASEKGWIVGPDGKGWRRLVPSPAPIEIIEVRVIEQLVRAGVTVICAGGGGVPVVTGPDEKLAGVEAVIDKDLASALLARQLDADFLMMLTDVEAVYDDWGKPTQRPIRHVTPQALSNRSFAEGSMKPKIDAAVGFVNETGKRAAIGRLEDALAILGGKAGTTIALGGTREV